MKCTVTALVAAAIWLLVAAAPARANSPVLTVEAAGIAPLSYTAEALAAFTQIEVRTHLEFVDGLAVFSGPRARDVLAEAIAAAPGATEAHMRALNDYGVVIPLEDIANYDVIFATSLNGKRLSLREKGPIWVMYPLDEHPELKGPLILNRLIWQLAKVTLR